MVLTQGQGNGAGAEGVKELVPVSNDSEDIIGYGMPYAVRVTIVGTAPILFHRWSIEGVEDKANAPKNSKAKKTDDLESYVYRCDNGNLGIPGMNLRAAIAEAARFKADPRSPRKSARDLYKAAIVPLTIMADLGVATWESVERHRVVVQRNAVTRSRPSLHAGWRATFELSVLTPEYISQQELNKTIQYAGLMCGLGDFRPTYGRFQVVNFEQIVLEA